MLGDYGIEQYGEGGVELCVAPCWVHYGPRFGQVIQNTKLLGWTSSQHSKGGVLPLKKCTTQEDGLASPNALYLSLEHK